MLSLKPRFTLDLVPRYHATMLKVRLIVHIIQYYPIIKRTATWNYQRRKRGNHYGNIITSNFSNGVSVAERRRRLVNGYYDKDKK